MSSRITAGGDADFGQVAGLLGDPTRLRVLSALLDGRALPASTLAAEAGVSAPTASAHLAKLVAAGYLRVRPSGRYRYYELARPEVAEAVEAITRLAPMRPVTSMRAGSRARAMRSARSCYDHLAGRLGVAVTEGLVASGALVAGRDPADRFALSAPVPLGEEPYTLGAEASGTLALLGVELARVEDDDSHRPLLRFCMDWTEQRPHLSGRLGAAVLDAFVGRHWVTRRTGCRAVDLTEAGAAGLRDVLGIEVGDLSGR